MNPYHIFQNIHFDFNQFYEDIENMTFEEIKHKIDKQK